MMKLLRAGYRRYFRNILFWIAAAASAILGFMSGVRVKEDTRLDDMYIVVGFIIFAALIALMIAIGIGIPARKAMKIEPTDALHDE